MWAHRASRIIVYTQFNHKGSVSLLVEGTPGLLPVAQWYLSLAGLSFGTKKRTGNPLQIFFWTPWKLARCPMCASTKATLKATVPQYHFHHGIDAHCTRSLHLTALAHCAGSLHSVTALTSWTHPPQNQQNHHPESIFGDLLVSYGTKYISQQYNINLLVENEVKKFHF